VGSTELALACDASASQAKTVGLAKSQWWKPSSRPSPPAPGIEPAFQSRHAGAVQTPKRSFDELVRENPDAFDYADCADLSRETGVSVPAPIQILIEERKAKLAAKVTAGRDAAWPRR
jgi:hypothetical protein